MVKLKVRAATGVLLLLSCALPPVSSGSPTFNLEELSAVFDRGGPALSVAGFVPPAPASVPSPAHVRGGSRIDIDAYCRGKGVCFLDAYAEELRQDTRLPDFIQDFYESFGNYASPLNLNEERAVRQAVLELNKTARGRAICANLTSFERCDVDSLAARKIKFQAKLLHNGTVAQTLIYAGEILVVVNRAGSFNNSASWIDTVGHELSHAEDYKKFKRDLKRKGGIYTEVKAWLTQLEIYNEVKGRDPHRLDKGELNFLIQLWAWKENGGPRPTAEFKDRKGQLVSAELAIKMFVGDAHSGTAAIRNMVRNYFYVNEQFVDGELTDLVVRELSWTIHVHGKEYNNWRNENPALASPVIYYTPPTVDDGADGGSGGTGGGTGGPNWTPNPQFQPGI